MLSLADEAATDAGILLGILNPSKASGVAATVAGTTGGCAAIAIGELDELTSGDFSRAALIAFCHGRA